MSGGNADYEAIVALLHAHRIALWMRDFEAYSACFVHAPSTGRWAVFRQKDVGIMRGWDEIAARARAFVADDPLPYRKNALETTIDDLTLHIGGDIAWASYVQNYPGEYLHGSDEGLFGPVGGTNELRILEKHEGRWKIAFLGFIEPNLKSFAGTLVRVDAQSRILWNNEVAEAEFANGDDLMRINGRLRLRDRRLDGRLRTAIKWASANGSFMPRRAAVPLVLQSGTGMPTRICWVAADAGMVLVSLNDRHRLAERLEAAALIFGLSQAQGRLAEHICDGLTLHEIAERSGVSVNTARTHLQRVYDKVGVRSQPALVRVLLSASFD